jgi:hypothetical protein
MFVRCRSVERSMKCAMAPAILAVNLVREPGTQAARRIRSSTGQRNQNMFEMSMIPSSLARYAPSPFLLHNTFPLNTHSFLQTLVPPDIRLPLNAPLSSDTHLPRRSFTPYTRFLLDARPHLNPELPGARQQPSFLNISLPGSLSPPIRPYWILVFAGVWPPSTPLLEGPSSCLVHDCRVVDVLSTDG